MPARNDGKMNVVDDLRHSEYYNHMYLTQYSHIDLILKSMERRMR